MISIARTHSRNTKTVGAVRQDKNVIAA